MVKMNKITVERVRQNSQIRLAGKLLGKLSLRLSSKIPHTKQSPEMVRANDRWIRRMIR
jgi:hypothetical protein